MIMYSYKKIAITNRKIFFEKRHMDPDFLLYARYLAKLAEQVDLIILREKDLEESSYEQLAGLVSEYCAEKRAQIFLHTYVDVAIRLKADGIHLPLDVFLKEKTKGRLARVRCIGISAHSLEDVKLAQNLGADYVTLSHIFATDCKKELKPRGLSFLENVCSQVEIPVYALGGINEGNEESAIMAGAAGACRMSDYM